MALADLIAVLRQEAELEISAVLEAARTEAEDVRRRNEAGLAVRHSAFLAERETDRRAAVELALATARREARRVGLEARVRLVERVLAAARAQFPDLLVAPAYRAGLVAELEVAVRCLADRAGTIRCHPDLVQELRRLANTLGGIKVLADAEVFGFKVVSDDGSVVIDGTLEDRLARRASRIRQELLAQLETPS